MHLSHNIHFNPKESFAGLDFYGNNHVSLPNLLNFFKSQGLLYNTTDLKYLFDKVDKDRDGLISYMEFLDEISPSI